MFFLSSYTEILKISSSSSMGCGVSKLDPDEETPNFKKFTKLHKNDQVFVHGNFSPRQLPDDPSRMSVDTDSVSNYGRKSISSPRQSNASAKELTYDNIGETGETASPVWKHRWDSVENKQGGFKERELRMARNGIAKGDGHCEDILYLETGERTSPVWKLRGGKVENKQGGIRERELVMARNGMMRNGVEVVVAKEEEKGRGNCADCEQNKEARGEDEEEGGFSDRDDRLVSATRSPSFREYCIENSSDSSRDGSGSAVEKENKLQREGFARLSSIEDSKHQRSNRSAKMGRRFRRVLPRGRPRAVKKLFERQ